MRKVFKFRSKNSPSFILLQQSHSRINSKTRWFRKCFPLKHFSIISWREATSLQNGMQKSKPERPSSAHSSDDLQDVDQKRKLHTAPKVHYPDIVSKLEDSNIMWWNQIRHAMLGNMKCFLKKKQAMCVWFLMND